MALQKKKPFKKATGSSLKKKSAAKPKKAVVKKTGTPKKSVMPVEVKQPVVVVKRSWFSFFRTGAIILALAAGAATVSLHPGLVQQFKASLLAQLEGAPETSSVMETEMGGILLSYEANGQNEQKLLDIFRTVFPDTIIKDVPYRSEEGQKLIQEMGITEVPSIAFEKKAFEAERLSEVVKDLFTLHGEYYLLNVSLVNPSQQVRVTGPLSSDGGVLIGSADAPITIYVYSDVKCQHCRVNEKNNTESWKKLVDEGLVRMVYLDLPQDAEATFHATALSCFYDQKKDEAGYLELRQKLYDRANLTKAYTIRELKRLGVEFETQCEEASYRTLFRARSRTADSEGITGVPALYIGTTGGNTWVRFTGSKEFSEYQTTLDKLLGQTALENTQQ